MSDPLAGLSPGQLQALNQHIQVTAADAKTTPQTPDTADSAAQAAYATHQATPQTLNVAGLDTHIPLPHWLDNTLNGMGGRALQLGENIYKSFGGTPDPLKMAVAQQSQTGVPGKVGSFLTDTLLTAPIGGAVTGGLARGAGLAARLAANPIGKAAIEGAVQGGLTADPGHRLEGMGAGAALAPLLPVAGGIAGKVARGLKRTPEAQELLNKGVDLTPGLLNPEGQRNASEEAAQSLPLVGSMFARARGNALKGFQQQAVSEAAAPGATIAKGDVHEMLNDAYKSFQPLYDQAKGFPVSPTIMRTQGPDIPLAKAFKSAVADKSALASAEDRKVVSNFLSNELSRANGKSDSLLEMRSNVRDKIRQANLDGKSAQADLLKNGAQAITLALQSQLPKDAQAALQTADSKYGTYKLIEDAVARSKDRSAGLTATNLQDAVAAATPKSVYARGGGGPLRDLARAGKAVFDVRSPPTGARMETMLPGMAAAHAHPLLSLPPALARLAMTATPTGRAIAAGMTSPQQWAQGVLGAIPAPAAEALSRYSRAAALSPVLAQQRAALIAPQ